MTCMIKKVDTLNNLYSFIFKCSITFNSSQSLSNIGTINISYDYRFTISCYFLNGFNIGRLCYSCCFSSFASTVVAASASAVVITAIAAIVDSTGSTEGIVKNSHSCYCFLWRGTCSCYCFHRSSTFISCFNSGCCCCCFKSTTIIMGGFRSGCC